MTNNNSLSEDIYAVGQLMADNLNSVGVVDADVDDGLTTLANKILNASGGKTPTILTINLDKNFLEVGERVTVTGRLTDYEGNPIANASLISHSNAQTAPVTTDANGEYSIKWYYGTSAYNTVAHHYVTYAGDGEYRDSQSETKDVSFRRTSTLLLETPMITYTDEFDVKGSLIDGLGEPISNASVTLTWNDGSDHTATTTTSPTGGILLHRDAVTTAGTYSFQLSFDGGSRYVASNSSVVNVVPDKEESVLNILSPSSGSPVSDSVTVTGTLKDNDGAAMSGKSVSFSLNNVSVGTATVESDGSFTKTITGLVVGSNSITASFAATTTHTAANQSITVNRPTFDGLSDLSLIAGSQILSYADEQSTPGSQYATLETQLMNGDSPATIAGVTVEFWDFTDESAPYFLTSDETDSNGKASFTYPSRGVGDVPIKAICGSLLTKTFEVKDAYFYDSLTSNKNKYNVTSGSMSLTYGSNGLTAKGTALSDSFATRTGLTLPSTDYKVSYVLSDFTYGTGGGVTEIGFEDVTVSQTANGIYLRKFGGGATSTTTSATTGDVISLEITGTTSKTVKLYVNDELRATLTDVAQTGTHRLKTYQNRSTTFKDLIIEPL